MGMTSNTIKIIGTAVGAVITDAVACVGAFDSSLDQAKQIAIVTVFGSITSLALIIVGLVTHAEITTQAAVQAGVHK
jgi:Ca2+/Na+ antiporter